MSSDVHGDRREADRREADRYQLAFNLEPTDASTGEPLGWLIDISPEGMMIASDAAKEFDGRYRMRFSLPVPFEGYDAIDVEATAAWSKPAMNPRFHRTGFRELQLVSGPPGALERLIEDYHLQTV